MPVRVTVAVTLNGIAFHIALIGNEIAKVDRRFNEFKNNDSTNLKTHWLLTRLIQSWIYFKYIFNKEYIIHIHTHSESY